MSTSRKQISKNPMADAPSTSFRTLKREHDFRHPNKKGSAIPMLEELVAPHIESFDALFDDTNGPSLIQLAIDDMTPRVVYDGSGGAQNPLAGNKLESANFSTSQYFVLLTKDAVKVLSLIVAKPRMSDRQPRPKGLLDPHVYPVEVSGYSNCLVHIPDICSGAGTSIVLPRKAQHEAIVPRQ